MRKTKNTFLQHRSGSLTHCCLFDPHISAVSAALTSDPIYAGGRGERGVGPKVVAVVSEWKWRGSSFGKALYEVPHASQQRRTATSISWLHPCGFSRGNIWTSTSMVSLESLVLGRPQRRLARSYLYIPLRRHLILQI